MELEGEGDRVHQLYEDDAPVMRRECYLHRQIIDKRVGGLESDMKDIKYELRSIKSDNAKFYATVESKLEKIDESQKEKWDLVWKLLIGVLFLVALGRILDLDQFLYGLVV